MPGAATLAARGLPPFEPSPVAGWGRAARAPVRGAGLAPDDPLGDGRLFATRPDGRLVGFGAFAAAGAFGAFAAAGCAGERPVSLLGVGALRALASILASASARAFEFCSCSSALSRLRASRAARRAASSASISLGAAPLSAREPLAALVRGVALRRLRPPPCAMA